MAAKRPKVITRLGDIALDYVERQLTTPYERHDFEPVPFAKDAGRVGRARNEFFVDFDRAVLCGFAHLREKGRNGRGGRNRHRAPVHKDGEQITGFWRVFHLGILALTSMFHSRAWIGNPFGRSGQTRLKRKQGAPCEAP